MGKKSSSESVSRRTLLKAGAAIGALQFASPFVISARGEVPIRLGMVDPLTGVYAAIAQSEVAGARLAVEDINKTGGILGRPIELLVEDSANNVGTGVQKTRKLIDRDQVNCIIGDVNSGISLAMAGVTSEKRVLHIVSGGHTDAVTGKDCHWNVFRVCNTTTMDVNAIADTLLDKFGKKWYFLTPDYAYGHSVQDAFIKRLKAVGGEYAGGSGGPGNCYREETEWLHDVQFGAWRMLTSRGFPVRIICEDNLVQDLSGYRGLYVAFPGFQTVPAKPRAALEALSRCLPSIDETSPTTRPALDWELPGSAR